MGGAAEAPDWISDDLLSRIISFAIRSHPKSLRSLRLVNVRTRLLANALVTRLSVSVARSDSAWHLAALARNFHNLDTLILHLRDSCDDSAYLYALLAAIVEALPRLMSLQVVCGLQAGYAWQPFPLAAGTQSLSSGLMTLRQLQRLCFMGRSLEPSVIVDVLQHTLHRTNNLQELQVNIAISNKGAERIAPALRVHTELSTLHLSSTAIGDAGATALSLALAGNQTLRTLDLSRNSIGGDGCSSIAAALVMQTSLTSLNLAYNHVLDAGAAALAVMLQRNQHLCHLDVRFNSIGPEGVSCFGQGLQHNRGLVSLSVAQNRVQGGADSLGTGLASCSTLKQLDLSQCRIDDACAERLATGWSGRCSLDALDLSCNLFRGGTAAALVAALFDWEEPRRTEDFVDTSSMSVDGECRGSPLARLNLSFNSIGDLGMYDMAADLAEGQMLRELILCDCDIGALGAEQLALCIETMKLEKLNLNRNHIGNEGACALGLAVQRSQSLQSLHLRSNGIQEKGAVAVAMAARLCETMQTVDMRGNCFLYVSMKIKSILDDCSHAVEFLGDVGTYVSMPAA